MKTRKFSLLVLFVFAFSLILAVSPAFAADGTPAPGLPDWTNLGAVVSWLAIGGGAPILVGMVFSYVAENVPAWHKLPKWIKFVAPVIVAVLLGLGANYLLLNSDIIAAISPYWAIILSIIVAWFGTQAGYIQTKRAGYGAKYRMFPDEFRKG